MASGKDQYPGYGHLTCPVEPPHPPRPPSPGGPAAADLRERPAGDPRGGPRPGDADPVVARPGHRPRRLAHDDAARRAAAPGGGIPHRAAGLRHVRGRRAAGRPRGAERHPPGVATAASHPVAPGRGGGGGAGGRPPPRRPAPRVSSRNARRRPLPGRSLVAAGQPPSALGDVGPARLRRPGGPPGPARGHREPRPDGAGHALRGRPGGDGGRRPAGLRARLPPLAGSRRPRVDGRARLSRSPERPPGGGRADRSRPRGYRGAGRRPGSPARR